MKTIHVSLKQKFTVAQQRLADIGSEVGNLVARKNAAYGDSFGSAGAALRLLYPAGMRPDQFDDALTIARIWDKCSRIATRKDAFGESPYIDIAGYAILGAAQDEQRSKA